MEGILQRCCTSLNDAAIILFVTNTKIIDLNTPEGCVAYMRTLPIENLQAIAARQIDQFNYLLVCAADGELILRGAK